MAQTSPEQVLAVSDLRVTTTGGRELLRGVDLQVARGERLGLVGESGSGKSLTVRAITRLLPLGVVRTAGSVRLLDRETTGLAPEAFRAEVRRRVGFVFQDPMTALNPRLTAGRQLGDAVDPGHRLGRQERTGRAHALLERVGLPDPALVASRYPWELSGGMSQRVVIAMAVAQDPVLIVADEPTTALDVTVQHRVLALLDRLVTELGAALLLISHDLGVVREHADRVAVMQRGGVVEQGRVTDLVRAPVHPHTRELLAATPTIATPRAEFPIEIATAGGRDRSRAVISGDGLHKSFSGSTAVDGVDLFALGAESVGIVGESGSGKSTVLNLLLGLERADAGRVEIGGRQVWAGERKADRLARRSAALVFQDSWGALDPYLSVRDSVAQPLRRDRTLTRNERLRRVDSVVDEVGLPRAVAARRPHELSGGQRQRVGIARALVAGPSVLLADEPVSSLDVTIQARIIELLLRLQRERGLALVTVSHDLAVVRLLTNYTYVMERGRVVEHGPTTALIADPQHSTTQALVASIPRLVP